MGRYVFLLSWVISLACAGNLFAGQQPEKALLSRRGGQETARTDVTVQDVDGKTVRPFQNKGQKATVLFFVMADCPNANRYSPEFNRLISEYTKKGVRFFMVYAEPEAELATLRTHAREFGYLCPALHDTKLQLTRRAGATISPEAAIFLPDGKRAYLGRIDDRYIAPGKERYHVTEQSFRQAMDAVLTGKQVAVARTKAIGCFLPNTQGE